MLDDQSESISIGIYGPVPEGADGILTELSLTDLNCRASDVGQLQGRLLLCEGSVEAFLAKSSEPRSGREQLLRGDSKS